MVCSTAVKTQHIEGLINSGTHEANPYGVIVRLNNVFRKNSLIESFFHICLQRVLFLKQKSEVTLYSFKIPGIKSHRIDNPLLLLLLLFIADCYL